MTLPEALARGRRHGHTSRGWRSPTYVSWEHMISRCHRPNDSGYIWYGAKGITVCDRWRGDFAAFLEDMGERPAGKTIDRISSSGNYEPGNCRWVTPQEQCSNREVSKRRLGPTRRAATGTHIKTHCVNGHEYTPENSAYRLDGFRFCRTCKAEQRRRCHQNAKRLAALLETP